MLIVCPQCSASYQVSATSLGAEGRSVRCANCHTIWFATPVEPALESATSDMPFVPPAEAGAENGAGFGAFETPAFPEPAGEMPGDFAADRMMSGDDSNPPGGFGDGLSADIPEPEPAMMDAAPSIVPPIEDASALRYAAPLPGEDIESLAARREAERARHRFWRKLTLKMPNIATFIVLFGGMILVLIAARNPIVKYAPQTASFYSLIGLPVNLRGLDFENIRVTRDLQDGIPVLVVEGKIVTTAKGIAEVPRLRFAIHDPAGKEIYSWTMMPSRTLLASGETLPFRSRLASPPAEGRDVSIRFFNRRDAMSGFR